MPVTLRANTDLVVVAWLLTCPGITSGMAATQLPADDTSWASTGFVTATTNGGSPNDYYAARVPVVQVDTWGVSPGSNKPPWGLANNLAETVLAATYAAGRTVTLPNSYPPARVLSVWPITEPRRVYDDAGDYARYSMVLAFTWVQP